jgi:hypothetical protein
VLFAFALPMNGENNVLLDCFTWENQENDCSEDYRIIHSECW